MNHKIKSRNVLYLKRTITFLSPLYRPLRSVSSELNLYGCKPKNVWVKSKLALFLKLHSKVIINKITQETE